MVSTFSAVEYGPLYYRELEKEKIVAFKQNQGNFEACMKITKPMKEDLRWWIENLSTQVRKIYHGNADLVVVTDASLSGWGAQCKKQKTGGRWNFEEANHHINYLELLAIYYGLKSFCKGCSYMHVQVKTDSTCARSYINSMGGVKSPEYNEIAKEIWLWCIDRSIRISAEHIPDSQNDADFESRNYKENTEWKLDPEIVQNIFEIWGTPEIDMFATRLNTQLARYAAWHPDPDAEIINAFSCDWSKYYFYAFPCFSLIPRCMAKLHLDQGECILIAHVGDTEFVSASDGDDDGYTLPSPQERQPIDTTRDSESSSPTQEVNTHGLSAVPQALTGRKISEKATSIIMASWRHGTQKQYSTYIKKWVHYCSQRKIDKFQTNVNNVLEFLSELFDNNIGYSAINTARAALSAIGIICDGFSIGSLPLVVRFMKGVYNLRPVQTRYSKTWDISCVLQYLRKLSPVSKLSLKMLTFKLIMLLALILASRCQSLHLLSIDGMKKGFSSYLLQYSGLLKQSKSGRNNPIAEIRAYPPDRRLCAVFVMKEYLKRTETLCGNNKCLFISHMKPHGPAARDTIRRWLKSVMISAGVDISIYKRSSTES